MGIGIVLIFYFIGLSVAAAASSAVLVIATRWYLRKALGGRRRMMVLAGVFPFLCVAYAGAWFIGYAAINDIVFHHDPMLGDSWYTNIGDGYAISMIDVTDQGTVHPTSGPDNGLDNPQGIPGVRRLQVSGDYLLGSQDKDWFANLGNESSNETGFFAINTRTHAVQKFASEPELAAYAKQSGVTLALRPIVDVYQSYRMNWFEPVAGAVLILPPACIFAWLCSRIVLLKRENLATAEAAV